MLFGMFGIYQQSQEWVQYGNGTFTFNVMRAFFYGWQGKSNALVSIDISDNNTSDFSKIDAKGSFINNSVSTIENIRDTRHLLKTTDDVKNFIAPFVTGDFLDVARSCRSNAHMYWNTWDGWVDPVSATYIFHRPDLVTHIESPGNIGGAGQGNNFDGVTYGDLPYRIPYFPNVESVTLISSSPLANQPYVRKYHGMWPPKTKSIVIDAPTDFIEIQRPFPETLTHLVVSVANSATANDLIRLIANCSNIEYLSFTRGIIADNPGNAVPINGNLNLSFMPNLKRLQISSTILTGLSLNLATNSMETLILRSCFGLNDTDFNYVLNNWKNSSKRKFLNVIDCRKNFEIDYTDSNTNSDFLGTMIYRNFTTGSIDLQDSYPSAFLFKIGDFSQILDGTRNTFTDVNVSGITNVTDLDLSNSRIEQLILPSSTVTTILKVGGNKLDVVNQPTLINEFSKLTNLTTLYLSSATTIGNGLLADFQYSGQDSVNGFGNNPNFSGCTKLTNFWAKACKMSGSLDLSGSASTLQNIIVTTNNLNDISGSVNYTNLRGFYGSWNSNLDINFSRFPTLQAFQMIATGQSHIDLSGRTNTTNGWIQSGIVAINNPNLTTITFPSTTGAFRFPVNTTVNLQMYGNPLLSTITNWENITFDNNPNFRRDIQIQVQNTQIKSIPISSLVLPPYYLDISNCGLTTSEIDTIVNDIFNRRADYDNFIISFGRFFISTGNNQPITGTLQAPAGYKNATITSITNAIICRVTVSSIGSIVENDVMKIRYVNGMTQVNNQTYMVKNIIGNSFDLYTQNGITPIDSTSFGIRTSGGGISIEGNPVSPKEKLFILRNIYSFTGGSAN
jgi:hypothetical protein